MNTIRDTLEGFESRESYFVENSGYEILADVRDDLEVAFDYSGEPGEEGERYLRRGDQLLVGLPDFAEDTEQRKHLVKAAIDHYRAAASELDQDNQQIEDDLEYAFHSIEAGIDQIGYAGSKKSKTAEDAARMEDEFFSAL